MNIGIIGANSQVGTELCLLLRGSGYQVTPVIRSRWAGSFLSHHGFNCKIGEITDEWYATGKLNAFGNPC